MDIYFKYIPSIIFGILIFDIWYFDTWLSENFLDQISNIKYITHRSNQLDQKSGCFGHSSLPSCGAANLVITLEKYSTKSVSFEKYSTNSVSLLWGPGDKMFYLLDFFIFSHVGFFLDMKLWSQCFFKNSHANLGGSCQVTNFGPFNFCRIKRQFYWFF